MKIHGTFAQLSTREQNLLGLSNEGAGAPVDSLPIDETLLRIQEEAAQLCEVPALDFFTAAGLALRSFKLTLDERRVATMACQVLVHETASYLEEQS